VPDRCVPTPTKSGGPVTQPSGQAGGLGGASCRGRTHPVLACALTIGRLYSEGLRPA